jgi:hypothetical protein
MNQKQQLIQQIQSLEEQLKTTKEQLKNFKVKPEDAEIGDALDDGSIVFLQGDGFIFVMADPEFDLFCQYDESMADYFASKVWNDRSIAEWFLPDANLMKRAMLVLPNMFKNEYYWTSSKGKVDFNFQKVLWFNGVVRASESAAGADLFYMRAFRVIHF